MKCNICDHDLTSEEIKFNRTWKEWEPCGTCLDVIANVFEHRSEEELDAELTEDEVDKLLFFFDDNELSSL